MMTEYYDLKKQVFDATMALNEAGCIRLSAGNISARGEDENIAITPSGLPYDCMKVEDIVMIDLERNVLDSSGHQPSSEVPMHTAIYKSFPEVKAVVHTHSIYAITFSCVNQPLDILCVEGLAARGRVPVARYAAPGSEEAGIVAVETLQSTPGLRAILLKNHGLVAVGPDMTTAWQTAYKVEILAQITFQARQLGTPIPLTEDQIAEVYRIYKRAK
jgi:L-ribulose-5-phosphate 4-epimerase